MDKLYVAPGGGGSGGSGGIREEPLGSLEEARDVIRKLGTEEGIEVNLLEGTHVLDRGWSLSGEDLAGPVVLRGMGMGTRVIGGKILGEWRPVEDGDVLDRLAPEAREHVLQQDLKGHGVEDLGRLSSRGFGRRDYPAHLELFFDGKRMELARWPNGDYTKIVAAAEPGASGDDHGGSLGSLEAGFVYSGERHFRWKEADDVWVHGFWAWDWANTYERVRSIDENGTITTYPPHGQYGIRTGQRFYFLNVLEELDEPGEYYVDRKSDLIYFWPPMNPAECESAVSIVEEPLLELDGAVDFSIENLTLEYARSHGIRIEGGRSVSIVNCSVGNLGNSGVIIRGGLDHRVSHCHVYNTGDAGIKVEGGNRIDLTKSGHVVEDCRIHHIGQWTKTYQPGVMLGGVGITVSHNEISNGPHNAVQLSGNENLIEFNHIHHVCTETGDVGAFYMGRDWTCRGNIVRFNHFHDTSGVGMGSMAVYLDDCASGTTIYGNLFRGCTRAAFVGGGRDNLIENNIFVDCDPAVMIDGRGLDPSPVWHNMVYNTMKKSLDLMLAHGSTYLDRYPELRDLDEYYSGDAGVPPGGNSVVRNISSGGRWIQIHWRAEPGMVQVEDNLVEEDPGFIDAAGMDFGFKEDSPALKMGFRPIPFEKIGPRMVAEE
jgi:hypothetical protein